MDKMDHATADIVAGRLAAAAAALGISLVASIALSAVIVRTSYRSHCSVDEDIQGDVPSHGQSTSTCEAETSAGLRRTVSSPEAATRRRLPNAGSIPLHAVSGKTRLHVEVEEEGVDDTFKRSPSAEVVCTYVDSDEGIVSLQEGERCQVLGEEENGWIRIKTSKGIQGYFPASYLNVSVYGPAARPEPLNSPLNSPSPAVGHHPGTGTGT